MTPNPNYLRWRYYKIRKKLIRAVSRRLYRDRNRDLRKSIIVAGMGRSGTTWLAEIIAAQLPCRIMFEPFYNREVQAFASFNTYPYMRSEARDHTLYEFCERVFSGQIRHPWIDKQVDGLWPRYRLIKAIRANLFLKWIHTTFPSIPILFIMRHPCAVALSWMRLQWGTDSEIEQFLVQADLVDDFLSEYMEIITGARTVEEKLAVIWCISNLVPLAQFGDELNLVYYERLACQPETEIPRIFGLIGQPYERAVLKFVDRPSLTTTRTSAVVTGFDRIESWKRALSARQIANILAIVDSFGLGDHYGEASVPLAAASAS